MSSPEATPADRPVAPPPLTPSAPEFRDQMEMVVRGANVGIWYCPLPFDRLIWDSKVKEHFHLPPDADVTIELFYERIHPDDRERTRSAIEQSIANQAAYDIDYRTVSDDGSLTKWIRAIGRGFYDHEGKPYRFDGVTVDNTERMIAQVALRESESRFRNMSDNAPVMIWVTRADGYCEYLNQLWYTFTGQSEEDALGFGWLKMVHEEDAQAAGDAFVEANRVQGPFRVEYRLRRHDGEYRWCVDAATPRFSPGGEFLGYIGSVTDITDRALADKERAALLEREKDARREAERQSRMKDEFLATLSHELRTPLTAILGWSQLIRADLDNKQDIHEGLEIIERNARSQSQIIEDLLDMSRIISGRVRLDVQRLDLAAIVQAAVETVRPTAEAKGVRLQTVIDPLNGVIVSGDSNRLQQVMWNLLTNAVKFTARGGRIQVLLERVNSHLEISVIDTGVGIAPEFLPQVFDRFRQADASTTRRFSGLGLGLSIVKELIMLHGGSVRVKSAGLGCGATFIVTLPLTVVHPVPDDETERRHPTAPAESFKPPALNLQSLRVLVVDDEPDARALVDRVLKQFHAKVRTAASVDEALKLLRVEPFDVLISDIGMPDQDGYDLIRQVREMGPEQNGQIPAIALTAFARSEDRMRAIIAGFQLHVAKPVEPAELVAMVAGAAGRTGT